MKVRTCLCLAMVLAVCFAASVAHATLQDDVDQAVSIIERFEEIPESAIPPRVLRDAKGLAILTVTKAGFIVSGRGGVDLYLQPQSRNICWCVTGGHGRRDSVRSKRRILRQAGFSG
jgi:lipid-binding SYLF domain-containing protein